MKICIVCGARPNFIKVAPLLRVLKARQRDFSLIYTGREDDPTLEPSLFNDLQIPRPDVFLGVDCENLNELTGKVMSEFEHYLDHHTIDTGSYSVGYFVMLFTQEYSKEPFLAILHRQIQHLLQWDSRIH